MLFSQAAQHVIDTGRLPERLINLGARCRVTIQTQVHEPQKAAVSGELLDRQCVNFEFCFRCGAAVWTISYLAITGDDTHCKVFNPYIGAWLMEVAIESLKAANCMIHGGAV